MLPAREQGLQSLGAGCRLAGFNGGIQTPPCNDIPDIQVPTVSIRLLAPPMHEKTVRYKYKPPSRTMNEGEPSFKKLFVYENILRTIACERARHQTARAPPILISLNISEFVT